MKLYKLKMQKGGKGVFKMSTVKNPAIDSTLLYFNKEEAQKICFTDEEKRVFYAPAMIPDLKIFRKNINGEPALVTYDADFIEEAQINYFRNNGNTENNVNHSAENVEGLFPFESWIVHNYETDKAKELGLDVPAGTWVMGYKVDNDEVWEDVKAGKLDGLSIEATNLEHIFKHNVEMKKDTKDKRSVLAFLKESFNTVFNEASEKFEGEIAEVSKWWNKVTNDTFEIGEQVLRKANEGAKDQSPVPVGAGEYELKDGSRILTDSEGYIRYKFPAQGAENEDMKENEDEAKTEMNEDEDEKKSEDMNEDEAKAAEDEAKAAEDKAEESKPNEDEDEKKEPTEAEQKLLDEIVDLKQTIAELKAEKVKAEEDLEKMSKETPAAKPIPNGPTIVKHEVEKPYSEMSNVEKMRYNRGVN